MKSAFLEKGVFFLTVLGFGFANLAVYDIHYHTMKHGRSIASSQAEMQLTVNVSGINSVQDVQVYSEMHLTKISNITKVIKTTQVINPQKLVSLEKEIKEHDKTIRELSSKTDANESELMKLKGELAEYKNKMTEFVDMVNAEKEKFKGETKATITSALAEFDTLLNEKSGKIDQAITSVGQAIEDMRKEFEEKMSALEKKNVELEEHSVCLKKMVDDMEKNLSDKTTRLEEIAAKVTKIEEDKAGKDKEKEKEEGKNKKEVEEDESLSSFGGNQQMEALLSMIISMQFSQQQQPSPMSYFNMSPYSMPMYSTPFQNYPFMNQYSYQPRWQDIGRPLDQPGLDSYFGGGNMFDFNGQRQQDYNYNPYGRNPSSMGQSDSVYDLFASPRPTIRTNPRGNDLGSVFFEFKS